MRREDHIEYMRKRRAEHKEEYNARHRKRHAEQREKYNDRMRKYYAEHRELRNGQIKKYLSEDLNLNGVKKCNIREMSRRILKKCHTKLPGYQIHHCFGYEDPEKFIYIPRLLHIQIHQLLRDKNIPSDSDHWYYIRELVNSCEDYTYIKS